MRSRLSGPGPKALTWSSPIMTMPHMTGIDLAREIFMIRADIPIILCTGFSEAVDENITQLLGIKGLLMKPVALRDLAAAVSKILV